MKNILTANRTSLTALDFVPHDTYISRQQKRVKLSVLQALEAHRVVRRRGSHIF
jgi:hypothetical protein